MTVTKSFLVRDVPDPVQECVLTTLTAGVAQSIPLKGPSGLAPSEVSFILEADATTKDPVFLRHDPDDDSTSANTISVMPDTIPGGDITGAEVRVTIKWRGVASGGIS